MAILQSQLSAVSTSDNASPRKRESAFTWTQLDPAKLPAPEKAAWAKMIEGKEQLKALLSKRSGKACVVKERYSTQLHVGVAKKARAATQVMSLDQWQSEQDAAGKAR